MQSIDLTTILANDNNISKLTASTNHVLHAIIVVSNDSLYSKEFCKAMICKILTQNDRQDLANKVLHNSFIDLTTFEGEDSIKVVDIAPIIEKSYEKGIESDQKFCIIQNAQRLTVEAQNKLLKTLEEPSIGQYFFLCVPSRFLLLPTILSRCTIIELPQLNKKTIESLIKESGSQNSKFLAELAMGKVENITENATAYEENFEIAFSALTQIKSSANVAAFAAKVQKANIDLVATYLEQLITDCLKLKNDINDIWFESKISILKNLDYSQNGLIFVYNQLQKIKQQTKFNVSQAVLADRLTLAIAEGKHKND